MKKTFFLFLFLSFAAAKISNAQLVSPTHWSYSVADLGNGEFDISISVSLDEGWHIFSKDYVGISVPASLTLEKNDDYVKVGELKELGEMIKEEIDLGSEKEIAMYYKSRVVFVQTVKILSKDAVVKGSMDYMTCKEVCVPPATFDFEVKLHKD